MKEKLLRTAYFSPETEEIAIMIETEIAASKQLVNQDATTFEDYEAFDLFE
jgi:hypothetical protein